MCTKKTSVILLLFVFSLLSVSVKAGRGDDTKFSVGLKGAWGFSKIVPIKYYHDFSDFRFNNLGGGLFAKYNVNEMFSVQLEGNYTEYGAKDINSQAIYYNNSSVLTEYVENTTIKQIDFKTTNIEIPLLLQYNLKMSDQISPFVFIGGNFIYNLKAETTIIKETIKDGNSLTRKHYDDVSDRIKTYDYAPIIGGGVSVSVMDNISVNVDARYKIGVKNISNLTNENYRYTNHGISLNVGVGYNF